MRLDFHQLMNRDMEDSRPNRKLQEARLEMLPAELDRSHRSPGSTYTGQRIGPPLSADGVGTGHRPGIISSRVLRMEGPAENPVGGGANGGGWGGIP